MTYSIVVVRGTVTEGARALSLRVYSLYIMTYSIVVVRGNVTEGARALSLRVYSLFIYHDIQHSSSQGQCN